MSRPEPGGASGGRPSPDDGGVGKPGAFVLDHQLDSTVRRLDADAIADARGGVGEDVLDQGIDHRPQLGGADPHPLCPVRRVDRGRPTLLVGEHLPVPRPVPDHCTQVGRRPHPRLGGTAGLLDHPVDRLPHPVDVGAQRRRLVPVAERLRLQPESGQWGAETVRQVGYGLPLGVEQPDQAMGQDIERLPDLRHLRRPRRVDPGFQVTPTQRAGRLGEGRHRPHDLPSQPVGGDDGDDHQEDAEGAEHRPGDRDAALQLLVGHHGPHHHGADGRLDFPRGGHVEGVEHRHQHLVAALDLGGEGGPPTRAWASPGDSSNSAPTVRSSGNTTVKALSPRKARSTSAARSRLMSAPMVAGATARAAAIAWVSRSARERARSAAWLRTTNPSGTRKATITRAVTDNETMASWRLIASPRIDQLDPDPEHGLQVAAVGGCLAELGAQPRQVDVDRALAPPVRLAPHRGQ